MKFIPPLFLLFLIHVFFGFGNLFAQDDISEKEAAEENKKKSKAEKFEKFNEKGEKIFKYIPVPLYSYSTETKHLFGLAKYNIFNLSKKDTISVASKASGIMTFSTLGHFRVGLGTTLNFGHGKYMFEFGIGYRTFPEYLLGIGNDVSRDDNVEEIKVKKWAFYVEQYRNVYKDFKIGLEYYFTDYFSIEKEEDSFITDTVPGYNGGLSSGVGIGAIYDKRDYRYSPTKGGYIKASYVFYDGAFGSEFNYGDFFLDLRKYFNPYLKHVYAFQIYAGIKSGNVPFYSLNMMGGTDRMRGYYYGAIRDKSILDAQFEYRMPVWKIFGVTAFVGAGRVAPKFNELSFNDLWYCYGFGLRIMVDSKNRANLRFDFGWGQEQARGVFIGFTEAF